MASVEVVLSLYVTECLLLGLCYTSRILSMELATATVILGVFECNTLVVVLALAEALVERLALVADLVFSLRLTNSAVTVSWVAMAEEHFIVTGDLAAHVVRANTLDIIVRLLHAYNSLKVDFTLFGVLVVFICRANSPNAVLMECIVFRTLLLTLLLRKTVVSYNRSK